MTDKQLPGDGEIEAMNGDYPDLLDGGDSRCHEGRMRKVFCLVLVELAIVAGGIGVDRLFSVMSATGWFAITFLALAVIPVVYWPEIKGWWAGRRATAPEHSPPVESEGQAEITSDGKEVAKMMLRAPDLDEVERLRTTYKRDYVGKCRKEGPSTHSKGRTVNAQRRVAQLASLLALAVSSFAGCERSDPASYRCEDCSIILISIDTLRADHLGSYGYHRPTSPAIDALAKDGVLFQQAINTGGGTLPVHMSMMTSLPPVVHDVWPANGRRLDERRTTLAEQLRERGYITAGFVDAGYMRGKFGFDDGFDRYDDRGGHMAEIMPKVYNWLRKHRTERFFLFLHTYDVHSSWDRLPYDSPEPYNRLFDPDYSGTFTGCIGGVCASRLFQSLATRFHIGELKPKEVFAEGDLEYVVALYDGGVRYVDDQLALFFQNLRELGLYDRSLIILTSDHGEEFLEHGQLLHRQNYEEVAHVPLIMKLPGSAAAGRRVPALVSSLEIMPTILAVAGIEANPEIQGFSLLPLVDGAEPPTSSVLVAARNEKLRTPRWSLFAGNKAPTELYDLEADPGERVNVLDGFPEVADALYNQFRQIRDRELKLQQAVASGEPVAPRAKLDAKDEERLKSLGYLGP